VKCPLREALGDAIQCDERQASGLSGPLAPVGARPMQRLMLLPLIVLVCACGQRTPEGHFVVDEQNRVFFTISNQMDSAIDYEPVKSQLIHHAAGGAAPNTIRYDARGGNQRRTLAPGASDTFQVGKFVSALDRLQAVMIIKYMGQLISYRQDIGDE